MVWLLGPFLTSLVTLVSSSPLYVANLERHPLGRVVVFGDSVSDNGTGAWTASNHTWPADPAYHMHRFSNGPVWVENLAKSLGMSLDDSAVGGATSNNTAVQGFTGFNSTIPVPSVLDQVSTFLKNGEIGHNDLFVIMVGANDAFFGGTAKGVITAIAAMIRQLHERGATRFLFASYPDLGKIPLRAFSSPAASELLERFSISLQASLAGLWRRICQSHIQLGFVDIYTLFNDMMTHPSVYGFDPSTTEKSCLVGAYGEAPRTLCNNPDRYIFWDEYHPTRAAHKYIGALALDATRSLCSGSGPLQ